MDKPIAYHFTFMVKNNITYSSCINTDLIAALKDLSSSQNTNISAYTLMSFYPLYSIEEIKDLNNFLEREWKKDLKNE